MIRDCGYRRHVITNRTELHESLRKNRLKFPFRPEHFFLFFARNFTCIKSRFLKFFVEIYHGFSLWILIAKTGWKIETQIAGNCFGRAKKVAGSFRSKIQHPTCRDDADCRNSLSIRFVDFLWWCDSDNSGHEKLLVFCSLMFCFHEEILS